MSTSTASVLERLFADKLITIPACDGEKMIAEAGSVFTEHVDRRFRGVREAGENTPKTTVALYELKHRATFVEMFGSLSADTKSLCLTQSQIIEFCRKYRNCLHPDWAMFFLFRSGGCFLVAGVIVNNEGLTVRALDFEGDFAWPAHGYCVVVPLTS